MLRFMLIRILQALPVIFVVITATFFWCVPRPGARSIRKRSSSPK